MLDSTTIHMLVEGTGATLYMTLLSTFFGYVLGLPIGIILTITEKEGIKPNDPRLLRNGRCCRWWRTW